MEPVEFLQRVLPSSGMYCVAEFDTEAKCHNFVTSIEDMLEGSKRHVQQRINSYFALGSFVKDGRTAANVAYMRSLFIDVDCGEGKYQTKREAFLAARKFLKDTELDQLGSPIIVDSGGGVHLYWPLDRDVSKTEWLPAAKNLKKLCHENGFKIDRSVTSDAARVLRMPGTYNFNYISDDKPDPVPCTIKSEDGDVFNFEVLAEAIKAKLVGTPETIELVIPGTAPKRRADNAPKLFENNGNKFKFLLDKTLNGTGCGQLKYYIENASDDGMEPLWRGLLSWSMKCEDADEYNKYLSDLHPYTHDRMQQKLSEIRGPYSCVKIEENSSCPACDTCPHKGKITNPLVLARYMKTDEEEKEIVVAEAVEDTVPKITRPPAPKGYSYAKGGGIIMHKQLEKKKSDDDEDLVKDVKLLDYDLFVVHILNQNKTHTVYMVADKPTGAETITFPQRAVVSKDETLKNLAEQNVIAMWGANNDANLFSYVRAAVEEASRRNNAIVIPSRYGWQEDKSFVLGEKTYKPDGTIESFPMPSLDAMNSKTKVKGTDAAWLKIVDILIGRKEWMLLGLGLVTASGPLYEFTGIRGLTFNGCGRSGRGKTLALRLGAGFWGPPTMFSISATSSEVALTEAAGMAGSVGLLMDEATTNINDTQPNGSKNDRTSQARWAKSILYRVSEGAGKERSTAKGGLVVNTAYWKLPLFMTSNSYLMDVLASQDSSNEPIMYRLLEATLLNDVTLQPHEAEVMNDLNENYGVPGAMWVHWVVQNRDTCQAMVKNCRKRLTDMLVENNSERFWFDGCAALLALFILLGKNHANICDLPVENLLQNCIVKLITDARKHVKSASKSAVDVLNSYTRDKFGQLVVVRRSENSKLLEAVLGNSGVIDQTITRSQIAGRVEHDVTPGKKDYYIEIRALKQHCAAMGFNFEEFQRELEQLYFVQYIPKKNLLARTRGPEMRVNAIRISVPDTEADEEA